MYAMGASAVGTFQPSCSKVRRSPASRMPAMAKTASPKNTIRSRDVPDSMRAPASPRRQLKSGTGYAPAPDMAMTAGLVRRRGLFIRLPPARRG